MLRCSRHFLSIFLVAATLAGVCDPAHAAELGEARLSSHIGQPLVADIELAMIDDPAAAVAVRLASPEVYKGAGIVMPPVLASLNMSVMRRDGRQILHLTSLRPVEGEHLHLYLELVDKGQRTVRLATLWLTPDPHPAPAPVPVPASAPEPAPAPAPAPVAVPVAAAPAHAVPAPRPAVVEAAPARVRQQRRAPAASRHEEAKAAPAMCAQQAEQASVCAALDGKNAVLREQIGALEGKVKSLQAALGAPPATAAPAAGAVQEPPGPKPIGAIKPLLPRKHKAPPEPEAGFPWGWIGFAAAVLLALGSALLLLRRRVRTVRKLDIPAAPRLIERLRERFDRRTRPAAAPGAAAEAAAEAVEPTLE